MLNISEFSHNHHTSRVNLLAKIIRCGIPVEIIIGARLKENAETWFVSFV